MGDDIITIYASLIMEDKDLNYIPQEDLSGIIKDDLANSITKEIMNCIGTPCVAHTSDRECSGMRYIASVNLISNKELSRLRKIENAYNNLIK